MVKRRKIEEGNENIISTAIENAGAALENAASSAVTEYAQENVKYRSSAGLKETIIREELSNCCKWCHDLAGEYEYGTEPSNVYARHDNCKCIVLFKSAKGKYQDVWSKKEYETKKSARNEKIKILKLNDNSDRIERMKLSSTKSTKISLEAIYNGKSGLNSHRKALLKKAPEEGTWGSFERGTIETRDLAYLSADQKHEFALWRSKSEDILCHGSRQHCELPEAIYDELSSGKYELVAHTHVDRGPQKPSQDDRKVLETINQKESILVSIDGSETTFSVDYFDF